tara:strand:+ start:1899 stop:2435 length:537 start_codon:yes stop_codon:yes gene_type:complete
MAMSDTNKHRVGMRKVIHVTPTVLTDEYTLDSFNNPLAFNSTEIPDAVAYNGACSKLIAYGMNDFNRHVNTSMVLYFTTNQQNFGTIGNAISISDPDLRSAGYLGHHIFMSATANHLETETAGNRSYFNNDHNVLEGPNIFLQADTNSTSVYFTARWTAPGVDFTNANDIQFWFEVEY